MNTTRVSLLMLALFLCPSVYGVAQSNAAPDYYHQHKSAQKYQKSLMKQRRKQEKAQAKQAKRYRQQHQRQ